jgi:DNA-binding NarL/FixJ family response regulator
VIVGGGVLCAICESTRPGEENLIPAFTVPGVEFVKCSDPEAMVESAARTPPGIVVYAFRPDPATDLSILQILRRILPRAAFILISPASSMWLQRRAQSLRPIYYAVAPVAADELAEAVRSAIDTQARDAKPRASGRLGPG